MAPRQSIYSRPEIVRGEQCTTGALLAPTAARRQRRVVADVAKLAVGREDYYTRELADSHEANVLDALNPNLSNRKLTLRGSDRAGAPPANSGTSWVWEL